MKFEKVRGLGDSEKRLDCEVTRTFEGDVAMLDRTTREVMHPVVGARKEAKDLYVMGSDLASRLDGEAPVVLFDVGFGAGSNALAAIELLREKDRGALEIVSFDRSLNAFGVAKASPEREAFGFSPLPEAWEDELDRNGSYESARLSHRYIEGELPLTLSLATRRANVVFWDPFSPDQNPLLWNTSAFMTLRAAVAEDVILVTYSSATRVRSALLLAGFCVGLGPSTGGNRPTTVAALELDRLVAPLPGEFLGRLARSSAAFPDDAPQDALARLERHPQFA